MVFHPNDPRKCNFLGFASLWRFHLPLTMLAARMLGEVRAIVWSVGTSFKPLLGAVFLGWTPSSTAKSQNLVWRCCSHVVWLSWAFYFFEVPRLVLVGVMLNCIGQHITRSIWPWQASPGFKIFVKNIRAIQIEMCYWMKSGYFCCFIFCNFVQDIFDGSLSGGYLQFLSGCHGQHRSRFPTLGDPHLKYLVPPSLSTPRKMFHGTWEYTPFVEHHLPNLSFSGSSC